MADDGLTTDAADAWRAACVATREAAAAACQAEAERSSSAAPYMGWVAAMYAIRAMPLPPPPRTLDADGLSGRGA